MWLKYRFLGIVLLTLSAAGCAEGDGVYRELNDHDNVTNTSPPEAHDHAEGPHGGHILEFGEYHGEVTFADGIATIYVLGDDAKTAVPLTGASAVLNVKVGEDILKVALTASPLEGEAGGSTSRFVSEHGGIPESIQDVEGLVGTVVLTMGEKKFTAKITHEHGHHH